MSTAYLSRLDGPVSEANDPYHDWDDRPSPGGPRQSFLHDVPRFYGDSSIKNAVMTHGALHTSMYMSGSYYNVGDYTYYYNGTEDTNHAVAIAGWDDTKVTAGGTGAWLIKNSWDTTFGDNGYFWISYADTKACAYGASFQSTDTRVDGVHCHDEFGSVDSFNNPYAFNVFQTTQAEYLTSVGFYTEADGAGYDVRIYDTLAAGSPSGLLSQETGTIDTTGYHVVDLASDVALGDNDDFVVYVHITNGGTYPMSVDYRIDGYNSSSTASLGESFYSFDGLSWTDVTTVTVPGVTYSETINFSIKAFTVVPEPTTLILVTVVGLAVVRRRR